MLFLTFFPCLSFDYLSSTTVLICYASKVLYLLKLGIKSTLLSMNNSRHFTVESLTSIFCFAMTTCAVTGTRLASETLHVLICSSGATVCIENQRKKLLTNIFALNNCFQRQVMLLFKSHGYIYLM